jgi:uncharacterized protein (TIGR00725 family)
VASERRPIIGVIGEGDCSRELYEIAEEVGRLIAARGAAVVCGGLRGVMEAVCRGAAIAGGTTIGILPGTDRSDANPYVTFPLPTGMGEARNVLVVRASDALIAIGGRYGTLSEIALTLKLGKPLVGIRSWGLVHEGQQIAPFEQSETSEEAVDLTFRLVLQSEARRRGSDAPD